MLEKALPTSILKKLQTKRKRVKSSKGTSGKKFAVKGKHAMEAFWVRAKKKKSQVIVGGKGNHVLH